MNKAMAGTEFQAVRDGVFLNGMVGDVTGLIVRWRTGDSDAFEELLPLVYDELRELASRYLRRERIGHTLQATALVHEVYFRLTGRERALVKDRAHFFAVAAQAMRRILVDHARKQQAGKRISASDQIALERLPDLPNTPSVDLLALHDALSRLFEVDARQARIVELRYFGGLTVEEIAELLGISRSTVERYWRVARLWLQRRLGR